MKIKPCYAQEVDSGKIHPALKEYFGYLLKKTAFRFKAQQEELLQQFKLSPPHIAILKVLWLTPSLNQMTIGDELGVDKATMVKLLDGLEKKKLIRRVMDPNDRRGKLIEITPMGQKKLDEMQKVMTDFTEEFLEPLTKAERKTLHELLLRLVK